MFPGTDQAAAMVPPLVGVSVRHRRVLIRQHWYCAPNPPLPPGFVLHAVRNEQFWTTYIYEGPDPDAPSVNEEIEADAATASSTAAKAKAVTTGPAPPPKAGPKAGTPGPTVGPIVVTNERVSTPEQQTWCSDVLQRNSAGPPWTTDAKAKGGAAIGPPSYGATRTCLMPTAPPGPYMTPSHASTFSTEEAPPDGHASIFSTEDRPPDDNHVDSLVTDRASSSSSGKPFFRPPRKNLPKVRENVSKKPRKDNDNDNDKNSPDKDTTDG